MRQYAKLPVVLLSLSVTPLALFLSTSSDLYLRNQAELSYNLLVLWPFIALFLATVFFGGIILFFSKNKAVGYFLSLYLFLGPFFFLYSTIRHAPFAVLETSAGLAISLAIYLFFSFFASRKLSLKSLISFFSVVGIFLLLFEAYSFFGALQIPKKKFDEPPPMHTAEKKLPNIYLLVLDEYQADMFDLTLSDEIKDDLAGFTYFPRNTAYFGVTEMSLASIFSGKYFDPNLSQLEYRRNAYSSESSVLYWLKETGYNTYGYIRGSNEQPISLDLFDTLHTIPTKNRDVRIPRYQLTAFKDLWIVSNLPLCLSIRILGAERVEQILNGVLLPQNANVKSVNFFLDYLHDEKNLPASARFTYIYLLLPHYPYVFNNNCSVNSDLETTDPENQSLCATSLIVQFIKILKSAGHFQNSLIIVCGDHGAYFQVKNNELVSLKNWPRYSIERNTPRARALLLIKPVKPANPEDFIVSDYPSSLIDIAPTIAKAAVPEIPIDFDGVDLFTHSQADTSRKRYYYYYYKCDEPLRVTGEMIRFNIEDDRLIKDKILETRE